MKKAFFNTLTIIFIISLITGCSDNSPVATSSPASTEPQAASEQILQTKEIQQAPNKYEFLYKIDFYSEDDLNYFQADGNRNTAYTVKDGALNVSGAKHGGLKLSMQREFLTNSILHLRVKAYVFPTTVQPYPMFQAVLQPSFLSVICHNKAPIILF